MESQNTSRSQNSVLAEALRVREKFGLFPFPADPAKKKPAQGFTLTEKEELPSPEEIAGWKEWGWRNVRLAARTGAVSGIIVLDVDGPKAHEFVKARRLPPGPMVRSPRENGGLHYYFRHPGVPVKTTARLAGVDGLDIRGDGGIVILPPSPDHKTGRVYEWIVSLDDADPPDAPEWLLSLLQDESRDRTRLDVAATMAGVPEGQRDTELFRLASKFRQMNLQQDVAEMMIEWAADNCRPPFSRAEARAKVKWTYTNYSAGDDEARLVLEPKPATGEDPSNPLISGIVNLADAIEHGIEPPEELEPDVLLAGRVHHIFAPAAVGKSWLALWLTGKCLHRGQNVLYLDQENGPFVIAERLEDLRIDTKSMRNHLSYLPSPDIVLRPEAVANYLQLLDTVQPVLVVFDSWVGFLASAGLSEDSNDEVTRWSAAFLKPLKDRGITTVVLDHVPHEGQRSRGASRKKDEVDVQYRLTKHADFDRELCGEIRLHVEKDRLGWLPRSTTFSIGGTVGGGFVFSRSDGTVSGMEFCALTDKQTTVLNVLRDEFGIAGARHEEWRKSASKQGVGKTTFGRARDALIRVHLVRKIETPNGPKYLPAKDGPGSTPDGPKNPALTSQNPDGSTIGPFRVHGPGGAQQGPSGPHPLGVDPVDPTAETTSFSGRFLTPEQAQEVQRLIREGMAEKVARAAVLGEDA